ncbi:ATP-binding cassette domain-containing protein [Micromonospora sp. WMMD1102]|uniref:ABC transporter ATP-binding protein n=1 Tax=Micromonospora sp. WMMD1102 TaxID=3016105 RepID=UPI0024158036|nr:ATP-binding cassette domain-containing protein [Micromonospora sp. WMMD1102]MDG4786049.1 ATP-binding cassette domain-containing protein [Micromonospora sp. WMMD1102]
MSTAPPAGLSRRPGSVPALVRELPRVHAPLTALLGGLVAGQVAGVVLLPLAIGRLVTALTGDDGPAAAEQAWTGLTLLALALVLDIALEPIRAMVTARLAAAVDGSLAQRTVEGALRPAGVAHLDDPEVADRIEQARGVGIGAHAPGQAVNALAALVPLRLTGLASAILLGWAGQWWMPVVLGAAWVVAGRWQEKEMARAVAANTARTVQLRHAAYLRDLAVTAPSAKEVRLFGLHHWLVERFTRQWWDGIVEMRRMTTDGRRHLAASGLLLAAHLVVVVPLAYGASTGDPPVGQLTVALQALLGLFALGFTGDLQRRLHLASAAVPPALAVSALGTPNHPDDDLTRHDRARHEQPHDKQAHDERRRDERTLDRARHDRARDGADASGLPRREIRFSGVSFGYPGDRRPVLDALDLVIPAGSSLALVGDNGAGKSTVTKLLAGLYRPDGGRIQVDGRDLHDHDLASWRRQLAVVLQDFGRYPFSVRDNIAFGAVEAPADEKAVVEAARLGGFLGVEQGLVDGWDTPLSNAYTGGTELSGGQWQRLALSRALYAVRHGARVLVLDEPTAHLDIEAEYELYARFLEITAGITTILVSHRFATVRLAERIAVLRDGRVSEYGSHDELLAADGRYAQMFRVQSAPFTDSAGGRRG